MKPSLALSQARAFPPRNPRRPERRRELEQHDGKGGEIATNRVTDQETSALALHLVQASLVYVNTRMVQSVLGDPVWAARLSSDDLRGLSPLIYTHINPYGRFEVDLDWRLDFKRKAA